MWILNAIRSGDGTALILGLGVRLIAVLLILPIHEAAHGWMALRLGDPTAKMQGRLTLNPFAHLNLIGTLALLLVGFGWAEPVPINPLYFKKPKRDCALVALAGPLSNMLFALIAALLGHAFGIWGLLRGIAGEWILQFLVYFVSINISLAVFNLIPIPPLDGSRILAAGLPDRWNRAFMNYEQYFFLGFVLLLAFGVLDGVLGRVNGTLFQWIWTIAGLPFRWIR